MQYVLIILALISLGLAVYAGLLLGKLRQRKKDIEVYKEDLLVKLTQRRQDILESLRIIALAVTQSQCEVSEGVIRIKKLVDEIEDLRIAPSLQDFHRIYEDFADFSYLDAREALGKQEKFKQDNERYKKEREHEKRINNLCFELLRLIEEIKDRPLSLHTT